MTENDRSVYHSTVVREIGVATVDGVDAFRQQSPHIGRIYILNLIEQTGRRLDLAKTHAKAIIDFIVSGGPVEGERIAVVSQQEVPTLKCNAQLRRRLRTDVQYRVGPGRAA